MGATGEREEGKDDSEAERKANVTEPELVEMGNHVRAAASVDTSGGKGTAMADYNKTRGDNTNTDPLSLLGR